MDKTVRAFNIFAAGLAGGMGIYNLATENAVWAAVLLGLAIVNLGLATLPSWR